MFMDACNISIINVADSRNCPIVFSENLQSRI